MDDNEVPLAIIGAGPYGLSLAAHMRASEIPFRIFGQPMESWREQMPRGMLLKSDGFASNLSDPDDAFTLRRYCQEAGIPYGDAGSPVSLETFVSYGLEFQRRLIPQLEQQYVTRLAQQGSTFTLATDSGERIRARSVVVATGICGLGYVPEELAGIPAELVTHSSAHSDLSVFRGRKVAVIGAGASAIDIAALLHEAGVEVQLVSRRDSIAFHTFAPEPRPLLQRVLAPRTGLGPGWRSKFCTDAPLLFHALPERFRLKVVKRHLGPAPGWFMKQRVLDRFSIHYGASILAAEVAGSQVRLQIAQGSAGRRTIEVDHLIAATGYRPDIRKLQFLDDGISARIKVAGYAPVLNRNFACSVPGLYWVGLASANSFGPLLRFAYGADFTARRLSKHLTRELRVAAAPQLAAEAQRAS